MNPTNTQTQNVIQVKIHSRILNIANTNIYTYDTNFFHHFFFWLKVNLDHVSCFILFVLCLCLCVWFIHYHYDYHYYYYDYDYDEPPETSLFYFDINEIVNVSGDRLNFWISFILHIFINHTNKQTNKQVCFLVIERNVIWPL